MIKSSWNKKAKVAVVLVFALAASGIPHVAFATETSENTVSEDAAPDVDESSEAVETVDEETASIVPGEVADELAAEVIDEVPDMAPDAASDEMVAEIIDEAPVEMTVEAEEATFSGEDNLVIEEVSNEEASVSDDAMPLEPSSTAAVVINENVAVAEVFEDDAFIRSETEQNTGEILEFELRNGERLDAALNRALGSAPTSDVRLNSATSSTSSSGVTISGNFTISGGNNYTYIGKITPKKKGAKTFYVRIPHWYINAYPNSKWYLDKNGKSCKVVVTVSGKEGDKTKPFKKTLKLTADSRYWLGGWGDYSYELVLPPWIRMVFPEEEINLQDGTDEKFGEVLVFSIRSWKNASAKKKGKGAIMKRISFKDSTHYRIQTLTGDDAKMPSGTGDGNSDIIIE